MCVGVLVGNRIFPRKAKGINEKVQLICTLLLIFSMGVTLGGRPQTSFRNWPAWGLTAYSIV